MEGGEAVMEIFPEPVLNLPEADIPLEGITAYLSQGDNHQIIFMKFQKDVDFPPMHMKPNGARHLKVK